LAGAADPDHISELFAGFGAVSVRRMFSGAGVFADGLMIALVSRGVIYLKADDVTIPSFQREKLGPFSYRTKTGQRSLMSYWRMPERLYDDPEELARWAADALEAARRSLLSRGRARLTRQGPQRKKPRKQK
jgi:DNA transformation protein